MNTTAIFDKYYHAICHATSIAGEDLGAVRLGLQMAIDEQYGQQEFLHNTIAYYESVAGEHRAIVGRLQGLEDQLLAWLDEHGKDLPIMLPEDYDQRLADVIVEVLNQQRVTIRTQHEALEAQKEAMGRMRQPAAAPLNIYLNGNGGLSAVATGNHNGTVITVTKPDPIVPADWPHGEALYVELHRLARDGCGPSKPRYDDEREHGMPTANEIIARTGVRWFALLKLAGLKAPIRSSAATDETEAAPANGDATFRD